MLLAIIEYLMIVLVSTSSSVYTQNDVQTSPDESKWCKGCNWYLKRDMTTLKKENSVILKANKNIKYENELIRKESALIHQRFVTMEQTVRRLEAGLNKVEQKNAPSLYTGLLERNNLVAVLPKLSQEYEISFDLLPLNYTNAWQSVFHMGLGPDGISPGASIPGIWFHRRRGSPSKRSLHLSIYEGRGFKDHNTEELFPLQKWLNVKIRQTVEPGMRENQCRLHFEVNGQLVWSTVYSPCFVYYDVRVYAGSNKWYEALGGVVSDLRIENTETTQTQGGSSNSASEEDNNVH